MQGIDDTGFYVLDKELQGKIKLGWPYCRWDDNIKMDFKGVRYEDMNWMHLAQDIVQVINLWLHKQQEIC
jgi:hypothetical protein